MAIQFIQSTTVVASTSATEIGDSPGNKPVWDPTKEFQVGDLVLAYSYGAKYYESEFDDVSTMPFPQAASSFYEIGKAGCDNCTDCVGLVGLNGGACNCGSSMAYTFVLPGDLDTGGHRRWENGWFGYGYVIFLHYRGVKWLDVGGNEFNNGGYGARSNVIADGYLGDPYLIFNEAAGRTDRIDFEEIPIKAGKDFHPRLRPRSWVVYFVGHERYTANVQDRLTGHDLNNIDLNIIPTDNGDDCGMYLRQSLIGIPTQAFYRSGTMAAYDTGGNYDCFECRMRAYPTGLISNSGWSRSDLGQLPLWTYVDDTSALTDDFNTFLFSANGSSGAIEFSLADQVSSKPKNTYKFRYAAAKSNAGVLNQYEKNVSVTAQLYQGSTLIASDSSGSLTDKWVEHIRKLTPEEVALLVVNPSSHETNPNGISGLRLKFTPVISGTGNDRGAAVTSCSFSFNQDGEDCPDELIYRERYIDILGSLPADAGDQGCWTTRAVELIAETAAYYDGAIDATESSDTMEATGSQSYAGSQGSLVANEPEDAMYAEGVVTVPETVGGCALLDEAGNEVLDENGNAVLDEQCQALGIPPVITAAGTVTTPSIITSCTITVPVVSCSASIINPSIATSVTVTPSVVTAAGTVIAPTVRTTKTLTPSVVTAVGSIVNPSQTVSTSLTPNVVTASGTATAPSQATSITLIPEVATAVGLATTPSVSTAITLQPVTVTAAGTASAPTLVASITLTPAVVTADGTVSPPSTSLATTITPGVILAGGTVTEVGSPAPVEIVIATGSVIAPSVVAGPISLTVPVVTAAGTLVQTTIQTTLTLTPDVALAVGSIISPSQASPITLGTQVVTAAASVSLPTPSTAVTITPNVVSASGSIINPSTATSVTLTPSVVQANGSIISPTGDNDLQLTPQVITASASVSLPMISTAVTVVPGTAIASGNVVTPSPASSMTLIPDLVYALGAIQPPAINSNTTVVPGVAVAEAEAYAPGEAAPIPMPVVVASASVIAPDLAVGTRTLIPDVVVATAIATDIGTENPSVLVPEVIVASATVIEPLVSPDEIVLEVPVVGATATAIASSLQSEIGDQVIVVPVLVANSQVTAPDSTHDSVVEAPVIIASGTAITPTLEPTTDDQVLVPPVVEAVATAQAAVMVNENGDQTLMVPVITAAATVVELDVAVVATVVVPVVEATGTVTAPDYSLVLVVPVIEAIASVEDPCVRKTLPGDRRIDGAVWTREICATINHSY